MSPTPASDSNTFQPGDRPKKIAIFGATSEIGGEIAVRMARGNHLVLAGRRMPALEELAANAKQAGAVGTDTFFFDATDCASHGQLLDEIEASGEIDVALAMFGVLGGSTTRRRGFHGSRKNHSHGLHCTGGAVDGVVGTDEAAGDGNHRRVFLHRGGAGAPPQLRVRFRQGGLGRVLPGNAGRIARHGGAFAGGAPWIRDRADDERDGSCADVVHARCGGPGNSRCRPRSEAVGCVDTKKAQGTSRDHAGSSSSYLAPRATLMAVAAWLCCATASLLMLPRRGIG